jgi:hypothetical protein
LTGLRGAVFLESLSKTSRRINESLWLFAHPSRPEYIAFRANYGQPEQLPLSRHGQELGDIAMVDMKCAPTSNVEQIHSVLYSEI